MKKQILPILSLLFALQIAAGQNHKFAGIVSWYMSTEPVIGVKVSSFGAGTSSYTNEKGYFELTFLNKDPGDRIRLSIGKMDGAGNTLEVVNGEILEYLFLPNSPDDLHLQIVVGKPGQFQEIVKNNYQTLNEHSQRRLEEDSAKIQREMDVPTQSLEEVQRLKAALKALQARHRSVKSQLEEMSIQIALINRDTASEVVKQALANIDKGENIEKALVTLFNEDLDGAYVKAFRQKQRADREIERIVEKLEWEAQSRTGDSLFVDAAAKYERICVIFEENKLDRKKLADHQRSAAKALFDAGDYHGAAKFHLKSIATKESVLLDRDHPALAPNFAEIAITYYHLKNYYGALEAYQRCIDIITKNEGAGTAGLIFPYNGMALAHKANGNPQEAEAWFNKVVDLIEKKPDMNLNDRLAAYANVVNFYVESGNQHKAQSGYKKIISLLESGGLASSALLGDYLLKIAHTQQFNHEYDEAIKSLQYAIDSYGKTFPAEHPKIGDAHRMLAFVRRSKAFFLFSEKKYPQALAVFNEIAPGSDDDEVFNQRGVCHYLLGNYDLALEDYKKSAELNPIRKETDYYSQIGLAYLKKGDLKKAKDAFEDFAKKDPTNPLVHRNWASWHALKNDKKDALESLKTAVGKGFYDLEWLRSESSLDGLRGDVAFQQLVKEVEELGQGKK